MGHTSSSLLRSVGVTPLARPPREAQEGDIDLRDKKTPDAWISRDPELERLMGARLALICNQPVH